MDEGVCWTIKFSEAKKWGVHGFIAPQRGFALLEVTCLQFVILDTKLHSRAIYF
jgi:hypothetical protein